MFPDCPHWNLDLHVKQWLLGLHTNVLINRVTGYVQNGERQTGDHWPSLGHIVLILIAADRYLAFTLGVSSLRTVSLQSQSCLPIIHVKTTLYHEHIILFSLWNRLKSKPSIKMDVEGKQLHCGSWHVLLIRFNDSPYRYFRLQRSKLNQTSLIHRLSSICCAVPKEWRVMWQRLQTSEKSLTDFGDNSTLLKISSKDSI